MNKYKREVGKPFLNKRNNIKKSLTLDKVTFISEKIFFK